MPKLLKFKTLKIQLTLNFVVVTLALALVSFQIANMYSQRVVDEMINRTQQDLTARIDVELNNYFYAAERVTNMSYNLNLESVKEIQNPLEMGKKLLRMIKSDESVDYIYYANEVGGIIIAGKSSEGYSIRMTENLKPGKMIEYILDSKENIIQIKTMENSYYEARIRDWYRLAPKNGDLFWSDVYIWIQESILGVSVSKAYYIEGERIGVFGTDVKLEKINAFLKNLNISKNGAIYIVEKNGLLVASSASNGAYTYDSKEQKRIFARASDSEIVKTAQNAIENNQSPGVEIITPNRLKYHLNGKHYLIYIEPFSYGETVWNKVVVTPESDFMTGIEAFKKTYFAISIAFVALSALLGYFIARLIIKPIKDLNNAAQKLATGENDFRIELNREDEIGLLGNTFNRMADHILRLVGDLNKKNDELTIFNKHLEQKVSQRTKALEVMVATDGMTGVKNHKYLMEKLAQLLMLSKQTGGRVSIVMVDIDHFKALNDTYGHQIGDTVLKEFAALIQNRIREGDTFGRYGGEEFLLIFPGTTVYEANGIAESIRHMIESYDFTNHHHITASFGVAEYVGDDIESLLKRADVALYDAKKKGRNRVVSDLNEA